MKKVIFILSLSVLLMLSACSKADLDYYDIAPLDENTQPDTQLI